MGAKCDVLLSTIAQSTFSIQATRYNMNRLNHQFRTMMRTSKSKELTKDIEILSQTFERVVDRYKGSSSVNESLVLLFLVADTQLYQ